MQRMILEFSAERLPLSGVGGREHDGPSHDGGRRDGIVQPGDVEHRRHLREASLGVPHQLSVRTLEGDLTGGHRPGAQLVLEPIDPIAVRPAVAAIPEDDEEGQPASTRRRALGSGQGQRHLRADIRAEEFLAEQTPAVIIPFGGHRIATNV